MHDVADLLIWALSTARRHTLQLVADLPPDQMCRQSAPGEHHPAWILGHLLLGDTYLLAMLGDRPLSNEFQRLLQRYGPGAIPEPSPVRYDSKERLVDGLTDAGARRLDVIRRMTDDDLRQPTPDATLVQTQPTIGHHLHGLVFHEGHHGGQLSAWRTANGFAPARWAFAPRSRPA